MYFDPLEFPLLDETLIPPLPKDQPPQDENVAAEGPVEGQAEGEPSSDDPTQSGYAQAGDNQELRDDRNDEAANDYEQESEEAAPVETYDALCDPSLPSTSLALRAVRWISRTTAANASSAGTRIVP